jgi:hypothetical protein
LKVVDSKTYAGLRYVDLLAPLRQELTIYRARCGAPQGDELVFTTAGTKEHNPNNVRVRVLRRAAERASERLDHPLPDRLTPH